MNKPFSAACENNRGPILNVLKNIIDEDNRRLLEIGSGTGQHAVYFAPEFDYLHWVTSDVRANLAGIKEWLQEAQIPNIHGPIEFDVDRDDFPRQHFDLVYMANTFHIMSWKQNKTLMKMLGSRLREGAQVIIYGPFNYNGKFTSRSNEEFDAFLKNQDDKKGIRAFEDVKNTMEKNGFQFTRDYEMPANNRILLFMKFEHVKI